MGVSGIDFGHDAVTVSLALDRAALSSSRAESWSAAGRTTWRIRSIGRSFTPGAKPPQLCAASASVSASRELLSSRLPRELGARRAPLGP